MAITAGSVVWSGTGPTKTGQVLVESLGDPAARRLVGKCTVTGDGASSSFNCNWIDGTQVLPFTPTGMICSRSGGAATSSISIVSCVPTDATTFAVVTSANVNAATFILSFIAFKA